MSIAPVKRCELSVRTHPEVYTLMAHMRDMLYLIRRPLFTDGVISKIEQGILKDTFNTIEERLNELTFEADLKKVLSDGK